MDEAQARARYEELYGAQDDTAWGDIVLGARGEDDTVDWDGFVANLVPPSELPAGEEDAPAGDAPVDEPGGDEGSCGDGLTTASLLPRLEALEAAQATAQETIAAQQSLITGLRGTDARSLYAASVIPKANPDGQTGLYRFAPSAVAVLTNLEQHPGPESRQALVDHVRENGGSICMAPLGLIGASLIPAPPGPSADDVFLNDEWPDDSEAQSAIRALAVAEGITIQKAHSAYCKLQNG